MPPYSVGLKPVLVMEGAEDEEVGVSRRVEEGVDVVDVTVMTPNPNLNRKCQLDSGGGVRTRATRISHGSENKTKNKANDRTLTVPAARVSGGLVGEKVPATPIRRNAMETIGYVRVL